MSKRDHIEGLMAASLYEPLTTEEQNELDAWFAANPADRAEYDALRAFTELLPDTAPAFTGDLRPVLREELLRGAGRRFDWSFVPRFAWQIAGVLGIAAVLAVPVWQGVNMNFVEAPADQIARLADPERDVVSARADSLMQEGNYTEAHRVLSAQLAANPAAAEAGQWQATLARMEFVHFGRFAQAYDAYQKLRTDYGDVFASDPDNAYRYDLLEQTRDERFTPLEVIAAAEQRGLNGFHDLERIVARYSGPGNPVAELALHAMSDIAGALDTPSGVFQLAAYEKVRRRCSDPMAIAQLNDSLGQLYLAHTGDYERARQLFQENAECGDSPLAQRAQLALASLETMPR